MIFIPFTPQDPSFEVLSVERIQKPAFRLGSEVFDKLVVTRDGKQFTISLSSQHTGCGTVKLFAKGDKVEIKKSNLHSVDSISRDQIRLVK